MKIHLFLSCYIEKCDAQLLATVEEFLSVQITAPGGTRYNTIAVYDTIISFIYPVTHSCVHILSGSYTQIA